MSEVKVKVLIAKREKYFLRIQRLYDIANKVTSSDKKLLEQFQILLQVFDKTVKEFVETEFQINEIKCELDESFSPEFNDSLPEMVGLIRLVAAREFPSPKQVAGTGVLGSGKASEISSTALSQVAVIDQEKTVQLPRIDIPIFNGCTDEWPVFYELFKTLIHDNKRLSDLEKLQYLVSKLHGPAANICKALKPVASNYSIIWNALFDRYNDDRSLADSYIDQIFGFKPLKSESREGLTMVLDKFCTPIGALKQLSSIPSLEDYIFLQRGLRILDPITRREFEAAHRDKNIPEYNDFVKFLEKQIKTLPSSENSQHSKRNSRPNHSLVVNSVPHEIISNVGCIFCGVGSHNVQNCPKFLKLSPWDRYRQLKQKRICLKCFSSDHRSKECKVLTSCSKCDLPHHTLLHFEFSSNTASDAANNQATNTVTSLCSIKRQVNHSPSTKSTVVLATVVGNVLDSSGRIQRIRMLIDSGSQSHFITLRACKRLKLPIEKIKSSILGFGGVPKATEGKTMFSLSSLMDQNVKLDINSFVVDKIVDRLPSIAIDRSHLDHLRDLDLADPNFNIPHAIDGIIGAEFCPYFFGGRQVRGSTTQPPIAIESPFGFVLMGRAPIVSGIEPNLALCSTVVPETPIEILVKRFWEVEEVCPSLKSILSPEDVKCEEIFSSTVTRQESGRFMVHLPFREEPSCLGQSFEVAKKCLMALEKRLSRSPELRKAYNAVVADYLQQGHASLVTMTDFQADGYFIPHHGVFKPQSLTTPLRMVFNASAKTTSGKSLNDILFVGPKLQTDIMSLLINFRIFKIALTADIKQMYRQILVTPEHRKFQRFLWRSSLKDPIQVYELNSVVFGVTSSPFLALRTVHQLVEEEKENFPMVSKSIPRDMYMDDFVTSLPSKKEALDIIQEAKHMFRRGGFELTKWGSNVIEFLSPHSDENSREMRKEFTDHSPSSVLGLRWIPKDDVLQFKLDHEPKEGTKRNILSTVARIFDPMGLLAPVTLYAKALIKQLWKEGVDWDEPPSNLVGQQWQLFQSELTSLLNVKIPRHIGIYPEANVTLVGFSDASMIGYGAVLYAKVERSDCKPTISFVSGKSKVSPAKILTIPRLELCAAMLLSKLIKSVVETLKLRVPVVRFLCFTDSEIVLHWIRASPDRWQTFVANRVAQIQENTPIACWFHVDGKLNPADCLSRGLTSRELVSHPLWWNGPPWLAENPERWPINREIEIDDVPEAQPTVALSTITNEIHNSILKLIDRNSSFRRLLNQMVVILKFLKLVPRDSSNYSKCLDIAEQYLCRVVQAKHFSTDIKSLQLGKPCSNALQRLSPFVEKGIIRVGGRLSNADLSYEQCHPIVLPKTDHFTDLLIDYVHQTNCHTGSNTVLSLIRQKYWVLAGRQAVRKRVRACNLCFKLNPKPNIPKMGDLPAFRVATAKPFVHTGVDYAGPIHITLGRIRKAVIHKAYICLFICLATKAIHLELCTDLSTQTFLAAFKRFLSRRGCCQMMLSDCGTNFVGAKSELNALANLVRSKDYRESLSRQLEEFRIEWKFSPPNSPHFGGIWEANIKVVKSHLFRVIGKQILTYEELNTVLIQVEALLNSRPLCPLSSDPGDLSALTPAHFLTLTPLKSLPASDVLKIPENRLSRFQLLDQMIQSFWSRWKQEYLHELQVRAKWTKSAIPLKVGTVVIVEQPNAPPLHWPLGIVEEVCAGKDGVIRIAVIRTSSGVYKRPAIKLYPLPSQ